ncbi:MAG: hypothetical protein AAB316_10145 [Bacteroidota bacterium]
MGLTLHYSARLRKPARLPELVAEVEDICRSLDWKSHSFDETIEVPAAAVPLEPGEGDPKPIRLQGIFFTPTKCETAFLTFTPSGRTSTPMNLEIAEDLAGITPEMVYSVHVKTQYAGLQTHVALVTLLKYLEKKYCYKMKVLDEGNFWKTLDQAVLKTRFNEYWSLINVVKEALEKEEWKVTDEPLKLALKMEEVIRRRLGEG